MKRIQSLLGLVLASFMGTAVASGPGYLGDLVGQSASIGNTIAGFGTSFQDIYSFDIGTNNAETIATAVQVKLQFGGGGAPVYDINNFAIALRDIGGFEHAFDNTFDANGALEIDAVLAPSVPTAPGFYEFVVSGTTSGSAGGVYAGALSAAAVPEPKDWLLMLAGIGLVLVLAERAKRLRL